MNNIKFPMLTPLLNFIRIHSQDMDKQWAKTNLIHIPCSFSAVS